MQQDSLHIVTPDTAVTQTAWQDSTYHANVRPDSLRMYTAVPDTAKPDPKLMAPLPYGEPLTMKIEYLEEDYWSDGLVHIQKVELTRELEKVSGREFTASSLVPDGMAGDPTPYQFKTDNFVTILLMLSFFLVVWVISRSRHFLNTQIKDFFHQRPSDNFSAERTKNELRGQTFLIFQTCFVLGLLFFDWTQENQVDVFNQISPYKLLGVSVSIFSLYYVLKIGAYSFVNSIFFDRQQNERWSNTYLLGILALGVALLPVVLLVVYFDLDFQSLTTLFLCILLIDKLLLFYKCSRIFFNHTLGWVHLFLYFCTLEIMPILILFRALIYANRFLLTIN